MNAFSTGFTRLFCSYHFTLAFVPGGHKSGNTNYLSGVKYWNVDVPFWKKSEFLEVVKEFHGFPIENDNQYDFDTADLMPVTEKLACIIV